MKQGLSLRVSQHLALTPQLQQSIRLLQLSTLELSQEVEQMLDENPFLERTADEAPREEFGLETADTPVRDDDRQVDSESEFVATPAPASADTAPASLPTARRRPPKARRASPTGKATAPSTWRLTTANGAATHPRATAAAATTSAPMRPSSPAARSRCSPSCIARH